MILSEVNSQPDRLALIKEDISWWIHFFGPAITAYQAQDDEAFFSIHERYTIVNGYKIER